MNRVVLPLKELTRQQGHRLADGSYHLHGKIGGHGDRAQDGANCPRGWGGRVHTLNGHLKGTQGLQVGTEQRRQEECCLQKLRAKASVALSPAAPSLETLPYLILLVSYTCQSLLITPIFQLPSFSFWTPCSLGLTASSQAIACRYLVPPAPRMSELHRALPHLFSLYTCFSDELISSHGLTSVPTFTTSLAQQSSLPTPGEHLAQSIVHAQEARGAGAGTSQGCCEESGGWESGA